VFVGRAGEIAVLDRCLDATCDGTGRSVGVAGEPGIGKSSLLGEFAARAATAGHTVLTGMAGDWGPHGVFVAALEDHLSGPLAAALSRPPRRCATFCCGPATPGG
jgi:hypothetical protein